MLDLFVFLYHILGEEFVVITSSNKDGLEEVVRFKFLKWVGTIFFGILGSTAALSGLGLLAGGIALAFGNPLNILWPLLNILAPVLTSFWLTFGGFAGMALVAVGLFLITRKIYKTLKPPVAQKPLINEKNEKKEEEINKNKGKNNKENNINDINNSNNKKEVKEVKEIKEIKENEDLNEGEDLKENKNNIIESNNLNLNNNNNIINNINENLNINEKENEIKNININIKEKENNIGENKEDLVGNKEKENSDEINQNYKLKKQDNQPRIADKEAIEQPMEEIEVKTQIKEIIRKGEYHPYKSKYYYQTNNQLFPRVPDYLKPYYNFWVRSINSQTSLDPKAEPFHPKFKTELNANSSRWYPKDLRLSINASKYIPKKNRCKDKVTALTVYKPNVIDVKEQTGTIISNNIYAPTGLMYNLVNIIWQTLHKDILTSEPHLKAPMRSDFSKLPSIQIWNNEDISTRSLTNKLENANRHHSIVQIVPISIMSGKYETGTSKVYYQICIDPTSRSFNLFFLIASLTDKNIFTLSRKVSRIMYDSEKSFTSLSDKILKLPATSNVSEYDAKNGNVMNVIKNSLTHENERVISNQIAIDKVKDDFQRYVSPMRRFFNFPSRNIKNIHSNIIGIKRTKKTILRLSNNNEDKIKVNTGENKIEAKIDEKQFKGEASHNEISQTNTSGNYEQTIKYALEKSNENDTKGIEIKMSDSVNKKDNIDNNLNINEIINEEKSKQKKRMDDNKSKKKENDIEIKKEEKEIMNKSNLKFNMDPNSDENSLFHKISTVTTEEAKTKIPNQQKEQTKNFLIINGKSFFRGEELKETKKRKEEMPYSEVNNINRNNEESPGCLLF